MKIIKKPRTPMMPAEIDAAVKAIELCMTFDETKYWADKAEALAAWAKIYHDDLISRKAKTLKLYAYRQMGIVAGKEQPELRLGGRRGSQPGPRQWLLDRGMTHREAGIARVLAKVSAEEINTMSRVPRSAGSTTEWSNVGIQLHSARSALRYTMRAPSR